MGLTGKWGFEEDRISQWNFVARSLENINNPGEHPSDIKPRWRRKGCERRGLVTAGCTDLTFWPSGFSWVHGNCQPHCSGALGLL